jgi:hypothetical protein
MGNALRTGTWMRAIAVALASVFSLATVSTWVHAAQVEHTICLEHGELIHADELQAHGRVLASDFDGLRSGESDHHEHDACALSAPAPDGADVELPAFTSGDADTAGPSRLAVASSRQAPTSALYRLAPKTSPPA